MKISAQFVVQLARTLRTAAIHNVDNSVTVAAANELIALANAQIDAGEDITLSEVGGHLYFNTEFVPLGGRVSEAAQHVRKVFSQIGVSELSIQERLEPEDLRALLLRFQAALWTKQRLDPDDGQHKLDLRLGTSSTSQRIVETRELVAGAYVHLATLIREARTIFEEGGRVSIPPLRRALYVLADVSRGHDELLLALTRIPNGQADVTLHSTAVASLALLMGLRLGLDRRTLANLMMSAVFHDLGRDPSAMGGAHAGKATLEGLVDAREHSSWITALRIGQHVHSVETVARASVALECPLPPRGDREGLIPSMAARLISTACAFDSLVQPPPPLVGVRADQAVSMLKARADGAIDPSALALFTSVVGVYPVGSLVQLSGGQIAVVLATPDEPDRPTVKIVEENGAPADRVVELARDDVDLSIVRVLEPSRGPPDVLQMLLA